MKLLFIYFKPFNLILVLNQNKLKRKFFISIEYPDFNFNLNNQIDFTKFKSSLCNFNNRNFMSNSNEERSLVRFNEIKLNNNQLNKCFYMNENIVESFSVQNMNTIFLNLIKQTCKFESLVDLIEQRHVTSDIYQYPKSASNPNYGGTQNSNDFREVNLNMFFDYNTEYAETNEINGHAEPKSSEDNDYSEDESIDQSLLQVFTKKPARKPEVNSLPSRGATTLGSHTASNTTLNPQYVLNYDNIDNIRSAQIKQSHSRNLILVSSCINFFLSFFYHI
jgi:hypothetical protein